MIWNKLLKDGQFSQVEPSRASLCLMEEHKQWVVSPSIGQWYARLSCWI